VADSTEIQQPPPDLLLRAADAACDVLASLVRNAVTDADAARADATRVKDAAAVLQELFSEHADWFNARVSDALASERFTDEQRAEVRRTFKVENDDFAARGLAGARLELRGDDSVDADVADSLCQAGYRASAVLMSLDSSSDHTPLVYGSSLLLATAALCN
jgi:hypothetical protein